MTAHKTCSSFYYLPNTIQLFSGPQCISKNAHVFDSLGSKPVIVSGRTSATKSGALSDVNSALQHHPPLLHYSQVSENPTFENVVEAFRLCSHLQPDHVIGIGGGSAMDFAKCLALLLSNYTIDSFDFEKARESVFSSSLPVSVKVVCIPITCGTGSEVTPYSIITDPTFGNKRNVVTKILASAAFLDYRYLKSLPRQLVISTALDALSHIIEARMSCAAEGLEYWKVGLWEKLLEGTYDDVILDQLMTMQCIAGIAITLGGTTIPHAAGYLLTYHLKVHHGTANLLVMPSFLEIYSRHDDQLVKIVLEAMGMSSIDQFRSQLKQLIDFDPIVESSDLELFVEK
ncbi:hypothetical protein GEMRC1_007590 [Eukaryota sp. GEM-RC1]